MNPPLTVLQIAAAAQRLIERGRGNDPVYIQHVARDGVTTREPVLLLDEPGNVYERGFVWLIGSGNKEAQ